MKVEVSDLGSPSLTVLTVSVDVKQRRTVHELSELGCCVKVEVADLGRSPSPIVLMVCVLV